MEIFLARLKAGIVLCFASSLLSGCEIPVMMAANANDAEMTGAAEITFPAMVLIRVQGEEDELLPGKMRGYVNGNAKFELVGPTYGACFGEFIKRTELVTMSCENGAEIRQFVDAGKQRMSGVNVTRVTEEDFGYEVAFGWGNDANEAAVRAALKK